MLLSDLFLARRLGGIEGVAQILNRLDKTEYAGSSIQQIREEIDHGEIRLVEYKRRASAISWP